MWSPCLASPMLKVKEWIKWLFQQWIINKLSVLIFILGGYWLRPFNKQDNVSSWKICCKEISRFQAALEPCGLFDQKFRFVIASSSQCAPSKTMRKFSKIHWNFLIDIDERKKAEKRQRISSASSRKVSLKRQRQMQTRDDILLNFFEHSSR